MKYKTLKIILICLFFILMDIAKPFGYALTVEFCFLGVVFFALSLSLLPAVAIAITTGYIVDCTSLIGIPLHTLEFGALVLLAHYVLFHFRKKAIKIIIFSILLLIHILLRVPYLAFSSLFCITYVTQSALVYLLIAYVAKQWIIPLSAEPISPAF